MGTMLVLAMFRFMRREGRSTVASWMVRRRRGQLSMFTVVVIFTGSRRSRRMMFAVVL
jgi:hypothetical protein